MPRDLESLGERIAEHAAHLDAAMHRLLSDLREFDQGGGWHAQGARSCAHWLSWRVGWDLGTAREHVRVAGKLAELPKIDRALEHGELSYSKVRAMSRVATAENEDTILEMARVSPAHQLEKICRKYAAVQRHDPDVRPEDDAQRRYVTRRDTADGMVRIEAVLHPEEAAIVWAALDHVAKQQCHESQRISAEASPAGAVIEQHAHDGLPRRPGSAEAPSGTAAFEQDGQDRRCVPAETRSVPHAETSPAQTDVVPALEPEPEPEPDHEQSGRTRHQRPAGRAGRSRFDRADALVAIAQAHVRGDKPDRSPIEVIVTVEARVLARPGDPTDPSTVACFRDGTCVSPETARRLCCDAGVIDLDNSMLADELSGRRSATRLRFAGDPARLHGAVLPALEPLLARDPALDAAHDYAPALAILDARSARLADLRPPCSHSPPSPASRGASSTCTRTACSTPRIAPRSSSSTTSCAAGTTRAAPAAGGESRRQDEETPLLARVAGRLSGARGRRRAPP